ncbi:ribbon-helix-helix domain-containing protein [Pseudidiomarina andamanensis]|uniref:CopG family transcriptional regulator n=1 Tax=Pseudidiomarina andamanensis TaxID=1940690 RepID=A0AA92ER94_9GAMM|nr:CopG family transcriptional regulator [Pseudidiomarina andamanensis]MDS0218491.1 CopG family transcriptional regulator [Pseudidiomarina andamanensis]QGT95367.1 CopG family transcriptional regulator [Pseudidiomarina andamanensis]
MTRQSITLTEKNDQWLREHVDITGEYASKSELINDLIRRARRSEAINYKLQQAETSGFTDQSADEILTEFKQALRK